MMKKKNSRKQFLFLSIFLSLDLLLIFTIFKASNARFSSEATSSTKLDVALYALSSDVESFEIPLGNIVPSDEKNLFEFSIYNTDEEDNITETKLTYDLKIIATTNIPLTYELYMDDNCSGDNGPNILNVHEPAVDDDGTYFLTMTTDTENFGYERKEVNHYCLFITFPKRYNSYIYQDMMESIRVSIESKQIIE